MLGLLKKVDTKNLSASVSADLDRSVSANLAVDTSGITGGSLDEFKRAVDAAPSSGELCPECGSPLRGDGLCAVCPGCGWALCSPE